MPILSTILIATQIAQGGIVNPVLEQYGHDQAGAESGSLFFTLISAVLSFIMVIGVFLVLLNLVEAGINWISSGGDSSKVQKARDRILNAVVGIVVLSAAVAIWDLVRQFLGISLDLSILFPASN
jgi:hypothetical protein